MSVYRREGTRRTLVAAPQAPGAANERTDELGELSGDFDAMAA